MFGDVREIDYKTAKEHCLQWHYSDKFPVVVKHSYAVMRNGIAGIVTFGLPASPYVSVSATGNHNDVLELSRLALRDNLPNEASWFVARALKKLPYEGIIVAYADTAQDHHGGVYQALGFHYGGASKARTHKGYKGKHARHYKGSSGRVPYSSKHRYWISNPRRKFDSLWESLPYPKPDIA